MTGKVTAPKLDWGFITPDEQIPGEPEKRDVFYHISDVIGEAKFLLDGETVEFDPVKNDKGIQAKNIKRTQKREVGVVTAFDFKKGTGKIRRIDGKEIFFHHSDLLGAGFKRVEIEDPVEFSIGDYQGREVAKQIQRTDPRPKLERFAVISDIDYQLEELSKLAPDPDNWSYRSTTAHKYPVLRNYLYYTFERIKEEGKILYAKDDDGKEVCCFNTGLATPMQEEVLAFLEENKSVPLANIPVARIQKWYLVGFFPQSDRRFKHFPALPQVANYFNNPRDLVYDPKIRMMIDYEHIMKDNIDRFPPDLQQNPYALRGALEGAVNSAIRRVQRNYKAAIPQFYRGSLQLLLPLCLRTPEQADLALVVERESEVYRASTVLTLDQAYNNARLIARPDKEWLNP